MIWSPDRLVELKALQTAGIYKHEEIANFFRTKYQSHVNEGIVKNTLRSQKNELSKIEMTDDDVKVFVANNPDYLTQKETQKERF